ncbi:hypothetical protein RRG08_067292 [Elysia crispata]|uniref:Uncharacterized protein n=1 Tax=Elysia crispata TaxID=231223 RepID=A0AAE1DD48_9GAST|nr:hypothetical protein RRG08_067292 [Elysia crispata]
MPSTQSDAETNLTQASDSYRITPSTQSDAETNLTQASDSYRIMPSTQSDAETNLTQASDSYRITPSTQSDAETGTAVRSKLRAYCSATGHRYRTWRNSCVFAQIFELGNSKL